MDWLSLGLRLIEMLSWPVAVVVCVRIVARHFSTRLTVSNASTPPQPMPEGTRGYWSYWKNNIAPGLAGFAPIATLIVAVVAVWAATLPDRRESNERFCSLIGYRNSEFFAARYIVAALEGTIYQSVLEESASFEATSRALYAIPLNKIQPNLIERFVDITKNQELSKNIVIYKNTELDSGKTKQYIEETKKDQNLIDEALKIQGAIFPHPIDVFNADNIPRSTRCSSHGVS